MRRFFALQKRTDYLATSYLLRAAKEFCVSTIEFNRRISVSCYHLRNMLHQIWSPLHALYFVVEINCSMYVMLSTECGINRYYTRDRMKSCNAQSINSRPFSSVYHRIVFLSLSFSWVRNASIVRSSQLGGDFRTHQHALVRPKHGQRVIHACHEKGVTGWFPIANPRAITAPPPLSFPLSLSNATSFSTSLTRSTGPDKTFIKANTIDRGTC